MEIKRFMEARAVMRDYLYQAQDELYKILKEQIKTANIADYVNVLATTTTRGKGSTVGDDRRDYAWLCLQIGKRGAIERTYWLTLFYNDVDPDRGNPHTQVGRIQFWKNVGKIAGKHGLTPNGMTADGRFYLKPENADGRHKKTPIYIDADNYVPEQIVADFIDFVKEDYEKWKKEING